MQCLTILPHTRHSVGTLQETVIRLTSLFSALLVVTLAGCGKDDKPTPGGPVAGPNTQQPQPSDPKPPVDPQPKPPGDPQPKPANPGDDLSKVKPDLTMSAEEYDKQFGKNDDEARAGHAKVAGKVVELTGVVDRIGHPGHNLPYVSLKGKYGQGYMTDPLYWEKVSSGCEVTIRGKVSQMGSVGELRSVQIIKAGRNPAESFTATAIAKEFKTDLPASKKREDKWVYVEGDFVTFQKAKNGFRYEFTLKGDGDTNVVCDTDAGEKSRLEELKPGQKVKVLGKVYFETNPKGPNLSVTTYSTK